MSVPLQLINGGGSTVLTANNASALTLTLPPADGVAGAQLITNGAGALAFKKLQTIQTSAASFAVTSATLAEIAIGIWLLLGAKGVAAVLSRIRTAGVAK